jgi:hypothetical protein
VFTGRAVDGSLRPLATSVGLCLLQQQGYANRHRRVLCLLRVAGPEQDQICIPPLPLPLLLGQSQLPVTLTDRRILVS